MGVLPNCKLIVGALPVRCQMLIRHARWSTAGEVATEFKSRSEVNPGLPGAAFKVGDIFAEAG